MASWKTPETAAATPLKVTLTSARDVGSGIESARVLPEAKFVPKMDTSEPGATGPAVKLAEFNAIRLESTVGCGTDAETLKGNVLDWPPSGLLTRIP